MDDKKISITVALRDWNDRKPGSADILAPLVLDELRRQARILMSRERSNHTLQPTALVHEAFLRISEITGLEWENRSHFYAIAAKLMRQILVDHARRFTSQKRGSGVVPEALEDVQVAANQDERAVVAIDEALQKLAGINPDQAAVVEMKYFGGLTTEEIAEALGIGARSVGRKWKAAKIWLLNELSTDGPA
ncbi:MAG: sigma-70 family RNA polymerase sigma factor [Pyrinomonadaceae bacterium]